MYLEEESVCSMYTEVPISYGVPFSFEGKKAFKTLTERLTPFCLFDISINALPCICTLLDSNTVHLQYKTGLSMITYVHKTISEYTPVTVKMVSNKQFVIKTNPGCTNPKAMLNIAGYTISNSPPRVQDYIENAFDKIYKYIRENNIQTVYYNATKSDDEYIMPHISSRFDVPGDIMEDLMKRIWCIGEITLDCLYPIKTSNLMINAVVKEQKMITLQIGDKNFQFDPESSREDANPWLRINNFFNSVRESINYQEINTIEVSPFNFDRMGKLKIAFDLHWAIESYICKKLTALTYKEVITRPRTARPKQFKGKPIVYSHGKKARLEDHIELDVVGVQLKK